MGTNKRWKKEKARSKESLIDYGSQFTIERGVGVGVLIW